jgi:hypothetical protein
MAVYGYFSLAGVAALEPIEIAMVPKRKARNPLQQVPGQEYRKALAAVPPHTECAYFVTPLAAGCNSFEWHPADCLHKTLYAQLMFWERHPQTERARVL